MTDADLSRLEWIAERAAILEFDAGLAHDVAEIIAEQMWRRMQAEKGVEQ